MRLRQFLQMTVAALALGASAQAFAYPMILPVQGTLGASDGGAIDTQALSLTVRLYRTPTGGPAVHTETQTVPIDQGAFFVPLGVAAPLQTELVDGTELWVGVSVASAPELPQRFPLATTPYAAYAGRAATVDWTDIADVPPTVAAAGGYVSGPGVNVPASRQLALDGSACFPGDMWLWNGTTWSCGNPSQGIVATDGIQAVASFVSVDANVVQRVMQANNCPFGIRSIATNGTVSCAADENTDVNVFGRACAVAGTVLRGFDASGNPLCVADANTNAINRSCGANEALRGFQANGTPICVAAPTVDTNAFGRGCTGTNEVLRGFASNGNPVCVIDADTNTNAFGRSCTGANEVLRGFQANGTVICVTEVDTNTTYTGAFGMRVSGNVVTVADRRLRSSGRSGRIECGNGSECICTGTNQILYGWQDDNGCGFLSWCDWRRCSQAYFVE